MKLTAEEQAKVDRLAQLKQWRATGEKNVSDALLADAEKQAGWAVASAEAREQQAQARATANQNELQRQQAAQQARMDRAAEAFKRQARLSFPGTDAEFESAWPDIKADWQRRQTSAHLDMVTANVSRVRL